MDMDFANVFLSEAGDGLVDTLFFLTMADDGSPQSAGKVVVVAKDELVLKQAVDM